MRCCVLCAVDLGRYSRIHREYAAGCLGPAGAWRRLAGARSQPAGPCPYACSSSQQPPPRHTGRHCAFLERAAAAVTERVHSAHRRGRLPTNRPTSTQHSTAEVTDDPLHRGDTQCGAARLLLRCPCWFCWVLLLRSAASAPAPNSSSAGSRASELLHPIETPWRWPEMCLARR